MDEVYFRFEESALWEDSSMNIDLYQFRVIRRTPMGCWIEPQGFCVQGGWRQGGMRKKPRFILDSSRKKYAHPTTDAARESFIARKERQLQYLRQQQDFAQAALDIAKRDDFEPRKTFRHERLERYHSY